MELKKYPEKDIRNKRLDFSLIGLATSLAFVLFWFVVDLSKSDNKVLEDVVYEEEIVVMENTVQEKKPPPPPPPPTLEIVDDEIEIDDDVPEFEETETDQDEAIEIIEDTEEEIIETGEVFEAFNVEKKANFIHGGEIGFIKYVSTNFQYPQAAVDAEVGGMMFVEFVIDKNGNVSQIKFLNPPLGFGLEEEAIRVIKTTSGMWTPAEWRKQKVSMRFKAPINLQ